MSPARPSLNVGPKPIRLALIGLGGIGGELVRIAAAAATGTAATPVVGALVRSDGAHAAIPRVTSIAALLALEPDVVVECAGHAALREHGAAILSAGVDLVPASVGLFADPSALSEFQAAARRGGSSIRLSNGAIAGIDGLAAARQLGLESVLLRSVMPFDSSEVRGGAGEGATVVYHGPARGAALQYPRHANLAATVSLAGLGFDRTEVELFADAGVASNRHEIHVEGTFGRFTVVVHGRRIHEGSPSSRLVAGSLYTAASGGFLQIPGP